ncbi:CHAT domain-containing protein [Truncatella angustata]|uniref:CHAT domain-containing protein n=1 Tax=Truncatella angustata TaxID=152316 RepID=A0A9P8RID8_9PEZI|nr:CHAT domain-containing protein [Truncatella angustata]KAH6646598.1 CHAT domain-containing protein [Truncatella angustata]
MSGSDDAIQEARIALVILPKDHPDRAGWLNNLAIELAQGYQRTANTVFLDEAIAIGRQTLAAMSDPDSKATGLSNLSCHLSERYLCIRDVRDIEEAVQIGGEALQLTPRFSSERPTRLNNLGVALSHRYMANEEKADLDHSIKAFRECVNTGMDSDPNLANYFSNLGSQLRQRYHSVGAVDDLEESIRAGREAVDKTSEDDPQRPARVTNLGGVLADSFRRTGNREHLNESTLLAQYATQNTMESHVDSPMYWKILGTRLSTQYSRTGDIKDLEEAIQVGRNVLSTTRHTDPDRVGRLHSLSVRLGLRFDRLANMSDLHEAIQIAQLAQKDIPDHYRGRAGLLNHIGDLLSSRHLRTGFLQDLEEAIRAKRECVRICPQTSLDLPLYRDSLGSTLGQRYALLGAMADLDESIENIQIAVAMTPKNHPDLPAWLDNLSTQLYSKYLRSNDMSYLERSIQASREVVDLLPDDDPSYSSALSNLGHVLVEKFEELEDAKDLEDSIQTLRSAIDLTPLDHPARPTSFNVLAIALSKKYKLTNNMDYIEESINLARQVVIMVPEDHPDRTIFLTNLGLRLGDKCLTTLDEEDIKEAALHCDQALRQKNSFIVQRVRAGMLAVNYHSLTSNWAAACEAGSIVVPLLPKLTPRSFETSDKQEQLGEIAGLASTVAAAALGAKSEPFFEHQELAERFKNLREELQPPQDNEAAGLKQSLSSSHRSQGGRIYEANEELDKLIAEIQQIPMFEDFLGVPSEADMRAAARIGPIVVVNVSDDRCDAILIEQNGIRVLPLPRLRNQEIEKRVQRGNLGSIQTLTWLWDSIARSVLDALGFMAPPSSGCLPRLWWVLTGALVNFPIHAAGKYSPGSMETVLDRVMSSYVSSVKALIHGRRRRKHNFQLSGQSSTRAVLVDMSQTPRYGTLPFATKEVAIVRDICKATSIEYSEPMRTKDHVSSQLKNCEIFHFAGHGHTDSQDPASSYLLLNDWEEDPLTVGSLFDMNLRENSPFLAYLSACGTGQNKEEKLADESFHLIGACQLAGFRHVIGTLWEVSDELCVDVARITYEELVDGFMSDDSVCRGIHRATRHLRDRWLRSSSASILVAKAEPGSADAGDENDERGPRKAVYHSSDDEDGDALSSSLSWAPYVHFGV